MARAPRASPPATAVTTSPQPPAVGQSLAALREQQGLSLDELSRRAGVSKSMLSQIERAQANPTVAVVWRLANALGVPLAELLQAAPQAPAAPAIQLVAAHQTPSLRGSDGGCELRILGPIELAGQFEWYALSLQPGAELVSEAHEPGTQEHLSVYSGQISVQCGEHAAQPLAGQTVRYLADLPHALSNRGAKPATALLVVVHAAARGG